MLQVDSRDVMSSCCSRGQALVLLSARVTRSQMQSVMCVAVCTFHTPEQGTLAIAGTVQ